MRAWLLLQAVFSQVRLVDVVIACSKKVPLAIVSAFLGIGPTCVLFLIVVAGFVAFHEVNSTPPKSEFVVEHQFQPPGIDLCVGLIDVEQLYRGEKKNPHRSGQRKIGVDGGEKNSP